LNWPLQIHAQQQASLPALKSEAVAEVDKMQTITQQMVDQIFSFSELAFQEFETSRYVTGILEKQNFQIERSVAGIPTAWLATYGSGKPVIAFITDTDCIPRSSQKPGVADHAPLVEGAPGLGEGHNSGMAVNVVAALTLQKLMTEHHISGTIKIFPGIAEELLGTKAHYIRAGLFKDVDLALGADDGRYSGSDMKRAFEAGRTLKPEEDPTEILEDLIEDIKREQAFCKAKRKPAKAKTL
jgi:aminobenzoyl-glutamate utilization protein B